MFPSMVAIVISSHGWIECDAEANVEMFVMPADMTIHKLSVSTLGNINVLDSAQLDHIVDQVKHRLSKSNSNSNSKRKRVMDDIVDDVLEMTHEKVREVDDHRHEYGSMPVLQERLDQFVYGIDKSHRDYVMRPNDRVINKHYQRQNEEAEAAESDYDWSMRMVNVPGEPDLFTLLKRQTRHGTSTTSLQEMVLFLQAHGVNHVLLIDLSCSVLQYPASYSLSSSVSNPNPTPISLTQRKTRRIRRRHHDVAFGGKQQPRPRPSPRHKRTRPRRCRSTCRCSRRSRRRHKT